MHNVFSENLKKMVLASQQVHMHSAVLTAYTQLKIQLTISHTMQIFFLKKPTYASTFYAIIKATYVFPKTPKTF